MALKKPFYRIASKKIRIIILVLFFIAALYGSVFYYLLSSGKSHWLAISSIIGFVYLLFFICFILFINIVSYHTLCKALDPGTDTQNNEHKLSTMVPKRWASNDASNHSPSAKQQKSPKELNAKKREAIRTLIIITLFYMFFNIPAMYPMLVLSGFVKNAGRSFSVVEFLLFYLSMLNGGCNSMVYILRNKKIRRLYRVKFFH